MVRISLRCYYTLHKISKLNKIILHKQLEDWFSQTFRSLSLHFCLREEKKKNTLTVCNGYTTTCQKLLQMSGSVCKVWNAVSGCKLLQWFQDASDAALNIYTIVTNLKLPVNILWMLWLNRIVVVFTVWVYRACLSGNWLSKQCTL